MLLGVDTGGTFTDFVLLTEPGSGNRVKTHKVLSDPKNPARAILQGIAELGLDEAVARGEVRIIHGSTVATNAALEGKGVRTAFITNRGFGDMLTLARQTRKHLYKLESAPEDPPVPSSLCMETGGRMDYQGRELEAITEADLKALEQELIRAAPEAIAINFLFSFLNPEHEKTVEAHLRQTLDPSIFICRSSAVLPEYREYERGIATWLNASLGPLVQKYLLNLREHTQPAPLSVMQSSGGTIIAEQAADRAVNLLLSGPAGGLAAAEFIGRTIGQPNLMTFDMGGTSTDVALLDGVIQLSTDGSIGPWPVAIPMVDMHSIGAGGGSIASIDAGSLLQVGPHSAGAMPGPACYGRGGEQATVTDANLVLGRLPAATNLAGSLQLDRQAAERAIQPLAFALSMTIEETALGIIKVANEHMARALRVISVERGYDPKQFRLCCFGGAGALHVCHLAEALGMSRALVPANAGVLSALGMLVAPVERQLSKACPCPLEALDSRLVEATAEKLAQTGLNEIKAEGINSEAVNITISLDLRYQGQSSSLTLDWRHPEQMADDFHQEHSRRYGHALPAAIEVVNIRVALKGAHTGHQLEKLTELAQFRPTRHTQVYGDGLAVPVYEREHLGCGSSISGPALITEPSCTIYIDRGWKGDIDLYGNLQLESTNSDIT